MINLKGSKLSLKVPISSLEKIGMIESTENIKSFFEKYVRYVKSNRDINLNDNYLVIFENSYFVNSLFLPIIIKNMIITNKKILEVVELSRYEIKEKITQLERIFLETEMDFEKIISFTGDLLKLSTEKFDKKDIINCSLSDLSDEFIKALSIYGVDKISDRVTTEVYDNINTSLITPIKDAFVESYNEVFDMLEEKEGIVLEPNEREMLGLISKVSLESDSKKLYFSIPLQTIISEVITKAIDEDLTFMKALLHFDFTQLVEKTIENINEESALQSTEELKETTKQIIKICLNLI